MSALAATLALGLHPTQTILLQHLLLRGGACNVSVATLASWSSVSEGTARTHLRLLQGAGWIEIEEHYYATSSYTLTAKARRLGLEPEAVDRPHTSTPQTEPSQETQHRVDSSTPTNFAGGGTKSAPLPPANSEVGGGTNFVPNYSLARTITSPPSSVVLVREGTPPAGRDLEGGDGGGDSDRAAPANLAPAWLPSHLRKPLEVHGIGSLEDLSAYSRGGIAGLCPALASVPKLDALEGALRRAGLWWSGSGWGENGPRLEVISGGRPPEASTPPKTSSPPPPTSAPPKSTGEPCELGPDWFSQEAYDAWQREAF